MSLQSIFTDLSIHLQSVEFRERACHADHANAFIRRRKQQFHLVREVSEQAFARARAKLSATAIPGLNDWLVARADQAGLIPRWQGLRLVAADASTLRFGLRASHAPRAACADQIAFGLFLPGAEMMLAASLHSVHENERQMLFQHLDRLDQGDLLLMDRGYPCRWLPACLNQRGIAFCMRAEKAGSGGFTCVSDFLRSGLDEQIVTLRAPDRRDALDFECPAVAQTVRLIRHVAPNAKVRVLMTNLLDTMLYPAAAFGDLYHQRWRIEEAFKRLKHRLNLEHVSGLSQLAVMQDFAAKVLCDNLQSIVTLTAHAAANLATERRINRAYVHSVIKPLLPALLLGVSAINSLENALTLVARHTYVHRKRRSKPRKARSKPHKHMTQKAC